MAFPAALDNFTNPTSSDKLNNPDHATQHANLNDAVESLEAKVGADSSATTTTHDYKLSGVTGSDKAVSKTGTETLTNKTLTAPVIATISNTGTLTLPTSTDTLVGKATTDTLTNKTLTAPKIADLGFIADANGNEQIILDTTTSAVNEITVTNAATGNAPSISATGGDAAIHLNLRGKGLAKTVTIGAGATTIFPYDYVVSGCVWSGDAYASTRNASMTAGVVVINGNPITVAAVTARSFTASKDVYVDVLDNGDGTGLLVYTDGTTNAASGALAANSIRLAIIVVGATNIASAASVNQGQEDRIVPIASSIPYAVTDSLGNLICPRDPQRKILGYRQVTVGQNFTTLADATGLSVTLTAPTTRKIKISFYACTMYSTVAGDIATVYLYNDGTQIQTGTWYMGIGGGSSSVTPQLSVIITPTTGSHTYKIGLARVLGTGTNTLSAAATTPAFIMVELV